MTYVETSAKAAIDIQDAFQIISAELIATKKSPGARATKQVFECHSGVHKVEKLRACSANRVSYSTASLSLQFSDVRGWAATTFNSVGNNARRCT